MMLHEHSSPQEPVALGICQTGGGHHADAKSEFLEFAKPTLLTHMLSHHAPPGLPRRRTRGLSSSRPREYPHRQIYRESTALRCSLKDI
jgi:hypothetical protein